MGQEQGGPAGTLDFYWNANGSSSWNKNTINSAGTIGVAVVRANFSTLIVSRRNDNSLWFSYNKDQTSSWPTSRIDGPGSTFTQPAMVHFEGSTRVAVVGPNGSLAFYWNVDGSSVWNKSVIRASGATNGGDPAISAFGSSGPFSGGTQITVRAPSGGLDVYTNLDGRTQWFPGSLTAAGTAFSDPSVSNGHDSVVAVQGPNNSLLFCWEDDSGVLRPTLVAGPGTTFTAPSLVRVDSATIISARDASNRVIVYRNANGSSVWTATVAG